MMSVLLVTAGFVASAMAQGFWQPQCNTPIPHVPGDFTAPTWDACRDVLDIIGFQNSTDSFCTDGHDVCTTYAIESNGSRLDCTISVCWQGNNEDASWCVSQRQAYHGLTALFDACEGSENEAGSSFVDAKDMVFGVYGQQDLSSRDVDRVMEAVGGGNVVIVETVPIADLGRRVD